MDRGAQGCGAAVAGRRGGGLAAASFKEEAGAPVSQRFWSVFACDFVERAQERQLLRIQTAHPFASRCSCVHNLRVPWSWSRSRGATQRPG